MEDVSHNRSDFAEELKPSSALSEDLSNHYLTLLLPGFHIDEVMLDIDESGRLIVSGERRVEKDKYIYFHQSFEIPKNSDAEEISGDFDGDALRLTIPKKPYSETKPQETSREPGIHNDNNNADEILGGSDGRELLGDENDRKEQSKKEAGDKRACLVNGTSKDRVKKMLKNSGTIIVIAALSFFIATLASRSGRFDPSGE